MEFGKRLRQIRQEKRLSQEVLAAEMNKKGKATISSWESGRAEPSLSDIIKLASVLGVTVGWLVEGTEGGAVAVVSKEPPAGYILVSVSDFNEMQRRAISNQEALTKS